MSHIERLEIAYGYFGFIVLSIDKYRFRFKIYTYMYFSCQKDNLKKIKNSISVLHICCIVH